MVATKHIVKTYRITNPIKSDMFGCEDEFRVEDVEGCDAFVDDFYNLQKVGDVGRLAILYSSQDLLDCTMNKCPFCHGDIQIDEIGTLTWVEEKRIDIVLKNDQTGKEHR